MDRESKFDGKLAIDTFFVRFGDVLQAGFVFVGLHLLGWSVHHFAVLNVMLALVWIALAYTLGREFGNRASERLSSSPPQLGDRIPDLDCDPGIPFRHVVPANAFSDPDPGDVLVLSARQQDGTPLPRWLRFDAWKQTFSGTLPVGVSEVRICVTASDMDGLKASSSFSLRRDTGES